MSPTVLLLFWSQLWFIAWEKRIICSKLRIVQEECHWAASTLFIQRPCCSASFLLTDCLSTFSAVVEHACSARSTLIQNHNHTRTNTRKLGQEGTRLQVFSGHHMCTGYLLLLSILYLILCLWKMHFDVPEDTHSFQITDVVALSLILCIAERMCILCNCM